MALHGTGKLQFIPSLEKIDPWIPLVMAGLDPAIQSPEKRIWMLRSIPGLGSGDGNDITN
jgi:hypothetical protein